MPLCENMEKALPKVSKTFKMLKSQFGMVYASYSVTRFMQKLVPRAMNRYFVSQASKKFTLAFSNTPGPIKSMYYIDL